MNLSDYSDEELKAELVRRQPLLIICGGPKRYIGSHKFPTFKELSTPWGPYSGGAYYCKECGECANTWSPGLESNTSECPGAIPMEKLLEVEPYLHEALKDIPGFKRISIGAGWFNIHYKFVSTKYNYPNVFRGCTIQLRGDS